MAIHRAVLVSLLLYCLFLNSCSPKQETKTKPKATAESILIIQPYRGVTAAAVDAVVEEVAPFFNEVRVMPHAQLPTRAWVPSRQRYRADTIIKQFTRLAAPGETYLGITTKDISTTKDGHRDWGVMGLAFRPGQAAVVSSYRMKNKKLLYKVALHELGHSPGLPHCPEKRCFMRDAEGGDPTASLNGFCAACTKHLQKKGWRFEG